MKLALFALTTLALSLAAGCASETEDPAESSIAVTQSGSLPITPPVEEASEQRASQVAGLPLLLQEPTIWEPIEASRQLAATNPAPVLPSNRP
jgi:hypothetical protein